MLIDWFHNNFQVAIYRSYKSDGGFSRCTTISTERNNLDSKIVRFSGLVNNVSEDTRYIASTRETGW